MLDANLAERLWWLVVARRRRCLILATNLLDLVNKDFVHAFTAHSKRVLAADLGEGYASVKCILGAVGKWPHFAMLIRRGEICPSVLARAEVVLLLAFALL
mgnify:CR=1 FL=1